MSHRERFEGVIGRTVEESTPWWPEPKRTVKDSPNVVVILFDDLGFSHFGCYGSYRATGKRPLFAVCTVFRPSPAPRVGQETIECVYTV